MVLYAGKPQGKGPPSGMVDILNLSSHATLGISGGLTLIKNSAAFDPPKIKISTSTERTANRVNHFATLERTSSKDAEHESYYPLAGNHLLPNMPQKIDGRLVNHYWVVSPKISDLIRQGEQEHLDDARRAYELTYKRIEKDINALAGKKFGPADSPEAAHRLVLDALEKRVPRELGLDPANWDAVLDKLLVQSKKRDDNHWHGLTTDPEKVNGNTVLRPVATTPGTRIGVPSSKVVNL